MKNSVGGIAEIINVEALVNVDFEDVRTVMSEQGKAMMGTATASGPDRARIAAEQAVACPLLEGVDMTGAKGVLVLITAAKGALRLAESREAMNTIHDVAYSTQQPMMASSSMPVASTATSMSASSDSMAAPTPMATPIPAGDVNVPSVWRTNRTQAAARVDAMSSGGMDNYEIPAFLRKQAD